MQKVENIRGVACNNDGCGEDDDAQTKSPLAALHFGAELRVFGISPSKEPLFPIGCIIHDELLPFRQVVIWVPGSGNALETERHGRFLF